MIKSSRLAGLVLASTFLAGLLPQTAQAHFIWLVPLEGEVRLVFGERPEPGDAALLDRIKATSVWQLVDGAEWQVDVERAVDADLGWYRCRDVKPRASMSFHCPYGVLDRGGKSMLLHYWGSYRALNPDRAESMANPAGSEHARLELIPWLDGNSLLVRVVWDGKPQPGCEVHVLGDGPAAGMHKTDGEGQLRLDAGNWDRLALRAATTVATPGEQDGKAFSEERHHATLVVDRTKGDDTKVVGDRSQFPELPLGLTSFGAAQIGDRVLLFGGQTRGAHGYSAESQNGEVLELRLGPSPAWSRWPAGRGVQGLGMVAHGQRLYRIGGFEARNADGEKESLHSIAEVSFIELGGPADATETAAKVWQPLAPLPEARSSFDACIAEDKVYVVGGWQMNGDEPTVWATSALCLDLADPKAGWKELAKPHFQRRALSVAVLGKQLFAMGGMEESGDVSNDVVVLDLEKGEWRDGPPLPDGGPMEGFGSAACVVGDRLVVSTYGGTLYRLSAAGDAWELIGALPSGRFFHRLLPWGSDQVLVIGGTNMESGKQLDLVVVPVG